MKLRLNTTLLLLALYSLGCNSADNTSVNSKRINSDSAIGKVELYDKNAVSVFDTNATIEVIGKGFNWSEGPVWVADKKILLFSDVPENKIFQWKENDSVKLFLADPGEADNGGRKGGNGSNGLAIDANGKLILCQSGARHVARLENLTNSSKPLYTTLSANYNGKKFNSPNDLVVDSRNNIYFTDPIYGLPQQENDPTRELKFEGVFKISPGGKTTLLIDSISRPNGLALSADEQTLYIASSDNIKPAWYAYHLENGKIKNGGILFDALPLKEKALVKQGPDGLKLDKYGNIFSAGPDGINIISPQGKLIGLIKIFNRMTSNCAFNETKSIVFITADDLILKIRLRP